MSASRSSEHSSRKPGKVPETESATAVDLTVSPAAPVASSSMHYTSSSSSSSSSSSNSSSSTTGSAREAQAPPRKHFVLHGSPIGGFTSLGTAPREQIPLPFCLRCLIPGLPPHAGQGRWLSPLWQRQRQNRSSWWIWRVFMDTERSMGRDLVRLVRQYCSQHPEAFGKLAGHNPVPEYTFNKEPSYAIPAPRSDWPEPPLPSGVDWDSRDHGIREYEERVMMFHMVNAAHSIVRLHDPTLHSDPHGDPVTLVRLRDISIGLRDN
eukprot:gene35861-46551_t